MSVLYVQDWVLGGLWVYSWVYRHVCSPSLGGWTPGSVRRVSRALMQFDQKDSALL